MGVLAGVLVDVGLGVGVCVAVGVDVDVGVAVLVGIGVNVGPKGRPALQLAIRAITTRAQPILNTCFIFIGFPPPFIVREL
jgi:hypothetical protein